MLKEKTGASPWLFSGPMVLLAFFLALPWVDQTSCWVRMDVQGMKQVSGGHTRPH